MSIYVSIDGDNIGRMVGHAALTNNEEALAKISGAINEAREDFQHLAEIHGGTVISAGGDEAVVVFHTDDDESTMRDVHEMIKKIADHSMEHYGFTITAGIGRTLEESSKALMAGKLNGKNQVVDYTEDVDQFIEGVKSGKIPPKHKEIDNEEFAKMFDEYLKFIDGAGKKESEPEMVDGKLVIDEHPIHEKKEEHFKRYLEQQSQQKDNNKEEQNAGLDEEEGKEESGSGLELGRGEEEAQELADEAEDDVANRAKESKASDNINSDVSEHDASADDQGQDVARQMDGEEQQLVEAESVEHDPEFDALLAEIHGYIKTFKYKASELESLRETDPELYEAMLGILSSLIETVRQAKGIPDENSGSDSAEIEEEGKESPIPANTPSQGGSLPPKIPGRS